MKSNDAERRRSGRRAGGSTTRADILAAARRRFAEHGYPRTTMRAVARDAGVDPALVHYFFGSKDDLFRAVIRLVLRPSDLLEPALEPGVDGAGARLVRRFVEAWEDPDSQPALLAMVRSAMGHAESAAALRGFVASDLQPRIAAAVGRPDGELRAVLVGAALVGLAIERYVLRLEPLASAPADTVVSWVGPTVQRYLTGEPG